MIYTHFKRLCSSTIIKAGFSAQTTVPAVELMCMICAHESGGGAYNWQVNGPAIGPFQMEPATHDDIWLNFSKKAIGYGLGMGFVNQSADYMAFNWSYAAFMARLFLLRISEPLPSATDVEGMARYAKQYWNTPLGKATTGKYADAYTRYTRNML